MSPLSFISQALEVFGSFQNVVFQRSAQLAKAFAAEALGLSDVAQQASWDRDCNGLECRLGACNIGGRTVGKINAMIKLTPKLQA